jgi:coenzyme F420-reducing hydrogenase gamma subunit
MNKELKLIEKIIRAKIHLEKAKKNHSNHCPIDMDYDYMGPCTCGASTANSAVEAALHALNLDDIQ